MSSNSDLHTYTLEFVKNKKDNGTRMVGIDRWSLCFLGFGVGFSRSENDGEINQSDSGSYEVFFFYGHHSFYEISDSFPYISLPSLCEVRLQFFGNVIFSFFYLFGLHEYERSLVLDNCLYILSIDYIMTAMAMAIVMVQVRVSILSF